MGGSPPCRWAGFFSASLLSDQIYSVHGPGTLAQFGSTHTERGICSREIGDAEYQAKREAILML
jgi:hypothetical protein